MQTRGMIMRQSSFITLLVVLALVAGSASAGVNNGLNWAVGCDGFTNNGGSITLNRDNTGVHKETIVIGAVDGRGNVIFNATKQTADLGKTIAFTPGATFEWSSLPIANPLIVTVFSRAGNGELEDIIYTAVGACDGLPVEANVLTTETPLVTAPVVPRPTGRAAREVATIELPNSTDNPLVTSPSVAINAAPPRPANPDGIGRLRDGYLRVGNRSTNMRSGDGPQYTVVGVLSTNTELIVLGRNARANWWYVQAGNIRGWVNSELVLAFGDLTGTPIVESQGEIQLPRFVPYRNSTLYQAAGADSAGLCNLVANREYTIKGRSANSGWLYIEADCSSAMVMGWIQTNLGAIRNSGDLAIPVISSG